MPRESAVMGLGAPKSDQLCPPGPVTVISKRCEAIPCVVMCSVEGAVHRDDADETRAVALHQSANAAKVAFAFFAHIAGEDDRLSRLNARFGQSARQARQRG